MPARRRSGARGHLARLVERFLHDGRAATVEEAITAHDGQGAAARDSFLGLKPEDRADLVAFLRSL